MSEVRLVVREPEQDWSGIVPGSLAERAIAALSADPVTLPELEAAGGRFEKQTEQTFLARLSQGLCDEPYDSGLVVIDLVARLVVVDSTYVSSEASGAVEYHDGRSGTDVWLRYCLADDWLFADDRLSWPNLAAQRRGERAEHGPLNARAVFYGRPLLEFIASRLFAARVGQGSADAADVAREVHAAWLLTPRDDLGGRCPREVALEHHRHLSRDLDHQAEHWSRVQECPPGIAESSAAYRYCAFGTHELVEYYELVRELLWSCHERLDELANDQTGVGGLKSLAIEDFVTSEVARLERVREEWLDTPDPECHGRTPRSIIQRERARLPEGVSGHEAMVDPDCPCCRAMADLPGPVFWHLDGCNMDDDFAFNIWQRTREEWDEEQRRWAESDENWKAKEAERERLGGAGAHFGAEGEDQVWTANFSDEDYADQPMGVRLFGISGHLSELICDLRAQRDVSTAAPDLQRVIDRLNRDYGNLREVLQKSEPSLAATLLDPVIDRFTHSLADVASCYPELARKCDSLTDKVVRLRIMLNDD